MKRSIARKLRALLTVLACSALSVASAQTPSTWVGSSADDNWTTGANWNPSGAPANDGSVNIIFGGTTRLTPNVDVDYAVLSITFNSSAGGFDVAGTHLLTIGTGGVVNNSTNLQSIANNITLVGAQSFNAASGDLLFGGNIDNAGNLLTVTGANTTTISGNISGAGGLTMSGTDTLLLLGTNTSTGLTTVTSGTLQGDTDSLTTDITNNSNLVFDQGADGTYSHVISGSGTFVKNGSGILTLGAVNTFTGNVTVNAGTLMAGVDGSLVDNVGYTVNGGTLDLNNFDVTMTSLSGSGTGSTVSLGSATLTVNDTVDSNYSGVITGSGGLTKQGTANLTLSGVNTFSGPLTLTAGTITQGAAGALPDVNYVINGGTLALNNLAATTSNLSGSGGIVSLGSATLTANQTGNSTYAGAISGTGGVTKQGAGNLTLSGTNTFSGPLTVSAGILTQGATGALPNANYVVNGGTLALNNLAATTSELSGSGGIVSLGTAALTVNQSSNSTYSGMVTGAMGSLVKQGSGALTLAGASTYTGATTVSGGTLFVDGSITSATSVASGATLGGVGSVNSSVTNNGTINPGNTGNTVGTLNVGGNFTNSGGATVQIKTNGTDNNKIIVTGNAALDGTVNVDTSSGFQINHQYKFLTAGTFTGDFSGISADTSQFVTATLGRDGNDEFFTLASNFIAAGQTQNERAVGAYIDQVIGSASGDLQTVFNSLSTLSPNEAANALEQMSGDIHGTMGQIAIQDTTLVVYQLAQHLRGGVFAPGGSLAVADNDSLRGTPIAFVGCDADGMPQFADSDCGRHWNGWVIGYGGGGAAKSDGNAPGINYSLGGTVAGVDRWTDDCHLLGVFGGYTGTNVGVDAGVDSSINGGQFGGYAFVEDGFSYYSLLGGFQFDSLNTHRLIQFGDINREAISNYNDWQTFAYLERGLSFQSCNRLLQPFLGVQYVYLRQNGFSEIGADSIDLVSRGEATNSLRSMVGARLHYAISNRNGHRTLPELHAMWIHEYLDASTFINARFASVQGPSFNVQGLDFGRDFGMAGASLTWEMFDGWSMYVNYDLQTNTQNTLHIGSGGIGRQW